MPRETYLYDILSVSTDASNEEISRSYKKMALRCHPDKTNHNPQLTEKFKEATRAYEVLKDSQKRKVYDYYGESGLDGTTAHQQERQQQQQRPPAPASTSRTSSYTTTTSSHTTTGAAGMHNNIFSQVFNDINSIFGNVPMTSSTTSSTSSASTSFFPQFPQMNMHMDMNSMNMNMNNMNMNMNNNNSNNMKKHVQPAPPDPHHNHVVRGSDIHHTFKVSLSDMFYGKVVRFQLPKNSRCKQCHGHGCFHPKSCQVCNGSGKVYVTLYNQFSKFQELSSCKTCHGTGKFIAPADRCLSCHNGYIKEKKIIRVNIPPGAKDGDRCILQGEADEGPNIIPGDVVIHLQEINHPYLIRRYNDLYAEYSIDLKTALLGGSFIMHDFLSPGNHLKIYINSHGHRELNDPLTQEGEIVGTINSGTPKIVKGLGMPINDSILDGVFYQDPNEPLELTDVIFDLPRYKKGNLFVKFNVQLPSLQDFTGGLEDLKILDSVLPSNGQGAVNPSHSNKATSNSSISMTSHLSNIPSLERASSTASTSTSSTTTPHLKHANVASSPKSISSTMSNHDRPKNQSTTSAFDNKSTTSAFGNNSANASKNDLSKHPSKKVKTSSDNAANATAAMPSTDSTSGKQHSKKQRPTDEDDDSVGDYNYEDIDIEDKIEGNDLEEEMFYNNHWTAGADGSGADDKSAASARKRKHSVYGDTKTFDGTSSSPAAGF